MWEGGEDPLFIARRLVVTASEDVGKIFQEYIFDAFYLTKTSNIVAHIAKLLEYIF